MQAPTHAMPTPLTYSLRAPPPQTPSQRPEAANAVKYPTPPHPYIIPRPAHPPGSRKRSMSSKYFLRCFSVPRLYTDPPHSEYCTPVFTVCMQEGGRARRGRAGQEAGGWKQGASWAKGWAARAVCRTACGALQGPRPAGFELAPTCPLPAPSFPWRPNLGALHPSAALAATSLPARHAHQGFPLTPPPALNHPQLVARRKESRSAMGKAQYYS